MSSAGTSEGDKRRRIVDAATSLFSRYGFKRTTIDLLAAEARIAKPTVYAYFEDKEAIFRAVVEAVCEELLAAARAASEADGPIEARLAGLLSAKHTRYWELVHNTPHAKELVESQGRLGGEALDKFDRSFHRLLVSVLRDGDELDFERVGLNVTAAANLLIRASSGAAYDATDAASHRKHLFEIVRVIVAALRRPPARA